MHMLGLLRNRELQDEILFLRLPGFLEVVTSDKINALNGLVAKW